MTQISRRKFIELSSLTGSVLVLGFIPGESKDAKVVKANRTLSNIDLNQFIRISPDGHTVLFNHRPEMGQGTFQSIPMILAEELEVDIHQVEIRQSPADQDLYGRQMVVGSRSIQTEFEKLRMMGASAREMLMRAAAEQWGVSKEQCQARDGRVYGPDEKSLSYGELVAAASKLPVPKNPSLKSPDQFNIIGTSVARQDIPVKINGQAKFGMDLQVPDMLYATIVHCPQFLGIARSYNREEVLSMPGVTHVLKTSRGVYGRTIEGVAVVGKDYWSAVQGRKILKVDWDLKGLDKVNAESIKQESLAAADKPGDELYGNGNVQQIFNSAAEVMEAAYETPYQAHVPMEPMNATVHIEKHQATFWGSTQNPNGMRSFISRKHGIAEENITINYTFMGGGFGRRSNSDVVEEAADLSKQTGVPIKLMWPREEDQTQGPFRACSYNVCKAVLKQGQIEALEHKVIAQEIRNQTGSNMKAGRQLMGGINTDYQIPNFSVKGVLQRRHIPIAYWRAVYHSTNPFAHESFIDELAHKAGQDPLDFRLQMLDHPRYTRVLKEVAKATNWGEKQSGTGKGIATVERSGAYFAMVVEVARREGVVVPTKITTAIDLGICINPDTVKAQTEGSIVMGLTAAYTGLTVDKGAIVEQNFNTYPLLRMSQCPEIETIILKSEAPPDGAGEAGLPTVAPALANAIFDLTGKRVRRLPLDLKELG